MCQIDSWHIACIHNGKVLLESAELKTLSAILLLLSLSAFANEFEWDINKSAHENVQAMDYKSQMLTLALLVKETGRNCEPSLHKYQGGSELGHHYWTIGCLNGAQWSVMLTDEGYQVISCTEWEKISRRSCLASF